MEKLREERTKLLDKSLLKKMDSKDIRVLNSEQDKEELLNRLMENTDFYMEPSIGKWLLRHTIGTKELVHTFQIIVQRALNEGRTFSTMEEVQWIHDSYVSQNKLWDPLNQSIGTAFTIGVLEGKIKKIKIRCCAVPIKEGRGSIVCVDKISIDYAPLKKIMKDYTVFIKFEPGKPENHTEWEAALTLSIYSALLNKVLSSPALIIGGITELGMITPVHNINDTWKEVLMKDDFSIISSNKNIEEIIKVIKNGCYNELIRVQHIEEIIPMLQSPLKKEKSDINHDILISTSPFKF